MFQLTEGDAVISIDLPNSKPNNDGGHCIFYRVGDKGLKLWASYSLAKEQLLNQTRASLSNCGPKVLGDMVRVKGRMLYGFYTELAVLHKPTTHRDLVNLGRRFRRAFGFSYPDLHDDNIGHVNGKLVYIDFDRF